MQSASLFLGHLLTRTYTFVKRFQPHFLKGISTPLLKVSTFSQRFREHFVIGISHLSQRFQPFPKGFCSSFKLVKQHLSQMFQPFPKGSHAWYHSSGTREKLSLVSKRCNKTRYLGPTFLQSLLDLTPGEIENTSWDILATWSSLAKQQQALGFKNLDFSTRC